MTNIVEKLAERVTSSLGTTINYGEKITLGKAEAVPVSLVTFGFGGGSGPAFEAEEGAGAPRDSDIGAGGGGGGASIPVGIYTEGPNGPRFVPNLILLLAVSIPLTYIGGKALSRIIRALKK